MNTCSTGRSFSESTKRVMWARSAGVCQLPGCAEILYLDKNVPKARVSIAELAHIIGFSKDGPRGDEELSEKYSDDPDNLLYLCRNCHKKVDASPEQYTVELLRVWKDRHEAQVLQSALLTRGHEVVPIIARSTQIGGRPNPVTNEEVLDALVADGYSAAHPPFAIEFPNEGAASTDAPYWDAQIKSVRIQFRAFRNLLEPEHQNTPIAVFPRAEMPMLMALGHGFGNNGQLKTYQPDSQRQTWRFRNDGAKPEYVLEIPDSIDSDVALTLELTSTIEKSRVSAAMLDSSTQIARLTVREPSRELVNSAEAIEDFRVAAQSCLTQLENMMGRSAVIHVFPSMPASLAFAFGTIIQPKASNIIRIYDARGRGGPFFGALDLPLEDSEAF